MKVSKIEHTRVGISNTGEHGEGILYTTPHKQDAKKDIGEHISKAVEKSKNLYSPFVNKSVANICYRKEKKYRDLEKTIETNTKGFIISIASRKECSSKMMREELGRKELVGKYESFDEKFFEKFVMMRTRKSLNRKVKLDGKAVNLTDILLKIVRSIAKLENEEELTEEELIILHEIVYEDYNKEKQTERIEKSIVNKDTKVQIIEIDGEKRIELSSIRNPKKSYISNFIHEYVAKTPEEQREMLSHQRRLLLLYVCGKEKYYATEGCGLMDSEWGGVLPDDAQDISEELCTNIQSEDYKDNVEDYNQLRWGRYFEAVQTEELSEDDKKWIGYYSDELGKLYDKRDNRQNPIKLGSKYILKYLWRRWTSFIAGKFVDIGKAVYYFAMPEDKRLSQEKENVFGVVMPKYQEGLTSFDYERIKAKELFARELAVYSTFAANIFSNATVKDEYKKTKGKEDVLSIKQELLDKALKETSDRDILQYFGGESKWKDTDISRVESKKLFMAMQKAIFAIRNKSYHYASAETNINTELTDIIEKLYKEEYDSLGYTIKKKYYSNNVLMFYAENNIDGLIERLYKNPVTREAQIPSFANVFKKKECKVFSNTINQNMSTVSAEDMEKYYSSLYFVLKEIYYYDFLMCDDLRKRFEKALGKINGNGKKNHKDALQNFREYIEKQCKNLTFGEMCQKVMTEYNQQNQGFKEKRVGEETREIYQHFRMLLYAGLKEAFWDYVKSKEFYKFLFQPKYDKDANQNMDEKKFCTGFSAGIFKDVEKLRNPELLSWYVVAHFITPKQLNHLQGSIKNYLQYIADIEYRAYSTCNAESKDRIEIEKETEYYNQILKVLSIVLLSAGSISHEFSDYFESQEEYAEYLQKYVDYLPEKTDDSCGYIHYLKAFCSSKVKLEETTDSKKQNANSHNDMGIDLKNLQSLVVSNPVQKPRGKEKGVPKNIKIGIYYDDMNPIINRNILYAKMFGVEKIVSTVPKVREKDIKKYYQLKQELEDVFKAGKCRNTEEQEKLRKYQELKNKVELLDIGTYTEILIECMSQLVSYTYLRERDNLFFQLGFHYMRLQYGKNLLEENEDTITSEAVNIKNGAILYQIAAMYDHNINAIQKDNNSQCTLISEEHMSSGQRVGDFTKFYSNGKYYEGMYFFENMYMHDIYSDRRNYIAHMKYMFHPENSILDLFSWMYNGFFDYDIKLKKSVSFIMNNILLSQFVKAEFRVDKLENKYTVAKDPVIDKERRELFVTEAKFCIKNIISERFVYKEFKKDKLPLTIKARGNDFCDNVQRILEYKEQG